MPRKKNQNEEIYEKRNIILKNRFGNNNSIVNIEDNIIKCISFSGGGVFGLNIIYFLLKLQDEIKEEGLFENVNNKLTRNDELWLYNSVNLITGTSVGSLLSMLIILKYSLNEIKEEAEKGLLKIFFDPLWKRPYNILTTRYGSSKIEEVVTKIIDNSPLLKEKNKEYLKNSGFKLDKKNNNYIKFDSETGKKIIKKREEVENHYSSNNFRVVDIGKNKTILIVSQDSDTKNLYLISNIFVNSFGKNYEGQMVGEDINCVIVDDILLKEAVISSCAVPYYFKPRKISCSTEQKQCVLQDNKLIDGCLASNIPSSISILLQYKGFKNSKIKCLDFSYNIIDKKKFKFFKKIRNHLEIFKSSVTKQGNIHSRLGPILTNNNYLCLEMPCTGSPFDPKKKNINKNKKLVDDNFEQIINTKIKYTNCYFEDKKVKGCRISINGFDGKENDGKNCNEKKSKYIYYDYLLHFFMAQKRKRLPEKSIPRTSRNRYRENGYE